MARSGGDGDDGVPPATVVTRGDGPPKVDEGIQFPASPAGGAEPSVRRRRRGATPARSSSASARAIVAGALASIDAAAAAQARDSVDWRAGYVGFLHALAAAGARRPDDAFAIARDGLACAWREVEFVRDGNAAGLAAAMRAPRAATFGVAAVTGRGAAAVAPFALPWRGGMLRGDALRAQLDAWCFDGVIEPSHAQAIEQVVANPDWLDLSDRTVVLLGAGAEAGPLAWLARWRANIVAVDLPGADRWRRIVETVQAGNARLLLPVRGMSPGDSAAPEEWVGRAGADLLTDTPELADWLLGAVGAADAPDLAALAYADGERHLRVAIAMDAIQATVCAARPRATLMFMASPSDVFVVPREVALGARERLVRRPAWRRAVAELIRTASGQRLLLPHYPVLHRADDGSEFAIADGAMIQQGPNYALAKRIQQWRALDARAAGHRVSINVTPSTRTLSVTHNPALRAGFGGAHHFGVTVFPPETTNALAAALWVHDLRRHGGVADPSTPLASPLELLSSGANHGGLWRVGYLPRTAMPIAALLGLLRLRG